VKTAIGFVVLSVVCCGCGCGSGATLPPEITDPESIAIRAVIDSINGASKDEFKEIFVGEAPKQKEFQDKYVIVFSEEEQDVVVNGDSAQVTVDVSQEDAEGQDESSKNRWTLKKVDGKWKVETAVTD